MGLAGVRQTVQQEMMQEGLDNTGRLCDTRGGCRSVFVSGGSSCAHTHAHTVPQAAASLINLEFWFYRTAAMKRWREGYREVQMKTYYL